MFNIYLLLNCFRRLTRNLCRENSLVEKNVCGPENIFGDFQPQSHTNPGIWEEAQLSGVWGLGSNSWVWTPAQLLTSSVNTGTLLNPLCFSLLICKMETTVVPTSEAL